MLRPSADFARGRRVSLFSFLPQTGSGAPRRRQPVALARRDQPRLRGVARPLRSGRTPLGAPPWRFLAGGRASVSGIASGECVQRAPRSQVVVPGGRGPEPSEPAGASRRRGTPLPAPPSGSPLDGARHRARMIRNIGHGEYTVKIYIVGVYIACSLD